MIASYFHLKGNLLSFNSHKTFITFLLLREIPLYSARLTNLEMAAVLWVPGRKAMSKSQYCGLEEGAHQEHSQGLGRKERKRNRSPSSSLTSQQTSGRMVSNALRGKGCKSAITTSFPRLGPRGQPGCCTGDRHLPGTGWRNYSRQGLTDISILEGHHPKHAAEQHCNLTFLPSRPRETLSPKYCHQPTYLKEMEGGC